MQLVLDDPEELGGLRQCRRVVGRHREDLAHPQIHPALAGPDVADTFQQLIKAVRHGGTGDGRVLQALVVQREALDQILAQALGGPAAELRAACGPNPIAHGQDGIEVVVGHPVVLAVGGSCQPMVDNWASASTTLGGVLGFETVEHGIGRLGIAAGMTGCDLGTQGFKLQLPTLFALLQQTPARPNHPAHIVEAPRLHLMADKVFEVTARGNTGRHDRSPHYPLMADSWRQADHCVKPIRLSRRGEHSRCSPSL